MPKVRKVRESRVPSAGLPIFEEEIEFVVEMIYCQGRTVRYVCGLYGITRGEYAAVHRRLSETGEWFDMVNTATYSARRVSMSDIRDGLVDGISVFSRRGKEAMMMIPWSSWEMIASSIGKELMEAVQEQQLGDYDD